LINILNTGIINLLLIERAGDKLKSCYFTFSIGTVVTIIAFIYPDLTIWQRIFIILICICLLSLSEYFKLLSKFRELEKKYGDIEKKYNYIEEKHIALSKQFDNTFKSLQDYQFQFTNIFNIVNVSLLQNDNDKCLKIYNVLLEIQKHLNQGG
jgi:hypothetical protein